MIQTSNKEALQATVHRQPVVKVVCIGDAGHAAAALMIQEGIEGVDFVYYDKTPISDDSIRGVLINAHLVIVVGAVEDANLFRAVGRVSKNTNLLTIGVLITAPGSGSIDTDAFDTLFLVPFDNLASSKQSVSDFLNSACTGLAEVLGDRQRLTIDFCDIKDMFTQKGRSAIGVGIGVGSDRVVNAVNSALAQPTFTGADFNTASAALFILKANSHIPMRDVKAAFGAIYNRSDERRYHSAPAFSDDASCMGTLVEGGNFGDEIRVTIVVTGMS